MARTTVADLVEESISKAVELGLCQQSTTSERLDGRHVDVDEQRLLSFSSCSYLGLELDSRLKRAVAEAAERFGVQFSSSRAYLSLGLYEELESLLSQIFRASALVTPTTTLGHLASVPVLAGPSDAIILDQQVHNSVQMAATLAKQNGTHVEILRHNNMDRLLTRVKKLAERHEKVWYACDGVYSAYGDMAPIAALLELRAEQPQFYLYVDDAHGMSWMGTHGSGSVRDQLPDLERIVIASSLNKAFGAAGGVIVFPDPELRRRVRTCGGPMIFSGPVQPPMLAAGVASARIHLSDEIDFLQEELASRIALFNRLSRDAGLPIVSRTNTPVRFVGVGDAAPTYDVAARLRQRGFFINISIFPAVPTRHSGIRLVLNRHHRESDIQELVAAIAEELPGTLRSHEQSIAEVFERFALDFAPGRASGPVRVLEPVDSDLTLEYCDTIEDVDRAEWEQVLGRRFGLGFERMRLLERVFTREQEPENRWQFHYYTVRDREGAVVLKTFFTVSLWKEDMLAPAFVSAEVEKRRASDPYYMTTRVFAMGSLLTEGNHLFLDRDRDWRGALGMLLARVEADRQGVAPALALRDIPEGDSELDRLLTDAGFLRAPLPVSMVVHVQWRTREEFLEKLSPRARRFQKRNVDPFSDRYVRRIANAQSPPSEQLWSQLYGLYRNVADRGLEINTFPVPECFFREALQTQEWELLILEPAPELVDERGLAPCGFVLAYTDEWRYMPLIVGLDYDLVREHGLYRQCLRHVLERAEELGALRVFFGLGAQYEKSRFGAWANSFWAYLRMDDTSAQEQLAALAARVASAPGMGSHEEQDEAADDPDDSPSGNPADS